MPAKIEQSRIDDIIKLYQSGMSVNNVAKRIGVNMKTADKYITERGVKRSKDETRMA